MYVAEKIWLFWHAAVRRVPSDREHEFSQGGKSMSYEDVCLVTANSGNSTAGYRYAPPSVLLLPSPHFRSPTENRRPGPPGFRLAFGKPGGPGPVIMIK